MFGEELSGVTDEELFAVSRQEGRCLVSLDMDFANVLHFKPEETSGIAIIRTPGNSSLAILERLIQQFLVVLKQTPIDNQLWIVESGRIRIHESKVEEE